jgi:hypothetical protein
MKHPWKHALVVAVLGITGAFDTVARAQIQYKTGQHVMPFYEGWRKNADGTYDMIFGYYNLNWEEDLYIPIGPDNSISGAPGGPDQGQPTIFFRRKDVTPPGERREQFVFQVRLPKEWTPTQQVVWTLTANGKTDRVIATLMPVEEVDDIIIAENRGGALIPENKPPTIDLSASATTVALPTPVTLTAIFSDDGLPKPRKTPVSSVPGVAPRPPKGPLVKWVYYRGPGLGAVTFEPARTPITSGKATVKTTATFTQPGTYVLRAWAEDGALYATKEVTITVTGRPSTQGQGAR